VERSAHPVKPFGRRTRRAEIAMAIKASRDAGTLSAQILSGGMKREGMDDVRADKWFDVRKADRHDVRESCFATSLGLLITFRGETRSR
jgi:hypothetical protein